MKNLKERRKEREKRGMNKHPLLDYFFLSSFFFIRKLGL